MAIAYPTYLYEYAPDLCRSGKPVISGSSAAQFGNRGLPALANWAYGWRTMQIDGHCPSAHAVSAFITTDEEDWVDITMEVPWSMGVGITIIRAYVWHSVGYVRLWVEDSAAWTGTIASAYRAGAGLSGLTMAINDTTGIEHRLKLQMKAEPTETAHCFAFTIWEYRLASGEIS